MDGCVQTASYEWSNGRWVATSAIIVNRRDLIWSSYSGITYRRRYVPIGAEK